MRSDILPAIALGMNAIWIHNETWSWEDVHAKDLRQIHEAESLDDLRGILLTEPER
jgi:FMN phosphatase YigB (HAD superfamily)